MRQPRVVRLTTTRVTGYFRGMPGKRGRPTKYTPRLADEIIRRLCEGESLRAICEDEDKPSDGTVIGWVVEDREGFSERYAKARCAQAHRWADEILDIADDGRNDTYLTEKGIFTDSDVIQRSRLRVDTRKWLLSKLLPMYGDKVALEHTGKNGGPIETRQLSDDEIRNRVRELTTGTPSKNGDHG